MNAELTEQAEAARETGAAAGFTGAQCANETADCAHAAPAAAAVRTPGLYRSSYEHDACGIGALAHLKGQRSHAMLDDALSVLVNLEHRGGTGLERNTGDGAGVLFQIPHRFFRKEAQKEGQLLPGEGDYGVAMLFFPHDDPTVSYTHLDVYKRQDWEGDDPDIFERDLEKHIDWYSNVRTKRRLDRSSPVEYRLSRAA